MRREAAAAAAVVLGLGAAAAEAQIYTRRNPNGVVEATNVPDEADFRLLYPGKGTLIHSRGFVPRYSGEFDHHIAAASSLYHVSPDLVKAVIQVESEFDQWAVSSKGARGLMQLMPSTGRRYAVLDFFDARQNIFGGVQYLRSLLDLFGGDLQMVLAAYNAGENAVIRYRGVPPYRETRGYVQKITNLLGASPAQNRALFFAPAKVAPNRAPARPAKLVPARPRIYYRWRDEKDVLHVSHTPPSDGTVYSMIRALD